jgi:hypothetical protein
MDEGIPIITSKPQTLATEVVENPKDTIVFKLWQDYTLQLTTAQTVNRYFTLPSPFSFRCL